jgi:hypothetical protein
MKKKLVLLSLLILSFVVFILVRYFLFNQQSDFGSLKVLSSPTASVFLNNLAVGKTPFRDDRIKENEYILKLIPEGNATETASWQGKIRVYRHALTYVDRELGSSDLTSAGVIFNTTKMVGKPKKADEGEIEVDTEPAGAIVYLDNDEKGIAPLILTDVPKGEHELSVYSPGFFRRTQKINVDPGYRVIGKFKLAIDQSQKKVEETAAKESTKSATPTNKKTYVIIKDTPTGWLRVREEPSINASEEAKVKPKDKFELLEEENGWYKIRYEKDKEGWVSGQYSEKVEE